MKKSLIPGVIKKQGKIFTENFEEYNKKIKYRAWNPYKSKLAAAILKGLNIDLKPDLEILYLGAATGTTVSHISDIVRNGLIYAVEISPFAAKKLVQLAEKRVNIIPIVEDANHPDSYSVFVPMVDFIYQDISQRNQAEIFINNTSNYLKEKKQGILIVKARSIDVSLKPKDAYNQVCSELEKNNLKIIKTVDLSPYEKDHAAILVST
jgi:fibrillarin-like pre-rRNA processing protein